MIRVLLFASLREIAGQGELELGVPESSGRPLTAETLFGQLANVAPGLERYRHRAGVAINERLASWDAPVSDGDEVAFYPPVSGGSR